MGSLGIGINYDVVGTVDKMMHDQFQYMRLYQMQSTLKTEQVQFTAYSALQSLFGNFQTQLTNLSDSFSTIAFQASSSNSGVVNNTTVENNSVGAGNHTVVVDHLAQAQQYLTQNQFATKGSSLNINETLTFTNNVTPSKNFSLQIKAGDTLENIRDNINNSDNNIGIRAAIISSAGTGGSTVYNLVLTSDSGTANAVNITGDTGNIFNFSQTAAAVDAVFTFDGLNQVKSSNTVDDVLDGLAFTLTGAGTSVISITPNDVDLAATVQANLQNMLNAYNQIIQFLDGNQVVATYDNENKLKSSAYNDAFTLIKMQLQQAVNTGFNGKGDIHSLSDLGVILSPVTTVQDQYDVKRTVQSFGSLMIDKKAQAQYGNDTTLQWTLNNDFSALEDFFTNLTSGFNNNLNKVINNSINPADNTGIIWNAKNSIDQQEDYTGEQIENEKDRLLEVRANLIERFTKLNVTIAMYQGITDYLDKQYEYLGSQMNRK